MAILNITYAGRSADLAVHLDDQIADADIKRIAAEMLRSGELAGLHVTNLPAGAFRDFVIDRSVDSNGVRRFYLRPKVPFGAA